MTRINSQARSRRRATLLALVASGLGPQAAAQAGVPARVDTTCAVRIDTLLDLPAVIARALAVNPAVTVGEENVRTARSEGRVANGAYLPSLGVTSNAQRSSILTATGAPGSPSATAYSTSLLSSIELFTAGRRGADRSRAQADLSAAEATTISQRFAVTLLAERAFYETLRGSDLMTVANARVARAERGLRYAQDRVRAGTATRSDELRARLELTAGRQQQLAARDTLQTAAYSLGRLVGADGPVGAERPASLEPHPLALEDSEIVLLAIETAPSVLATEASARATAANTRAARALYAPDVRLTGGYNFANQSPIIGALRPGWTLALGTTFPIFNGFQREDAVTRAEAASEIARVTAVDTRRLVRTEASRLLSALRFAEQNIALAGEAVTAAQEDLRVQTERYRAGISTALDRQTSELAVTQAELGLVAARYTYQITRATLEALVGRTL
ncbi:MAG: TolC family protein [Gemmatimonadota bacterium]|nr:TolC family protein [Gemmatimonadota bacterium]